MSTLGTTTMFKFERIFRNGNMKKHFLTIIAVIICCEGKSDDGLRNPVTSITSSWENYVGHCGYNNQNVNYKWRRFVRYGNFDPTTEKGYSTVKAILSGNHLMFADGLYPGQNAIGVDHADVKDNALATFLNLVEASSGDYVRNSVRSRLQKLVEARREAGSTYTIYWQLGNEINNTIFVTAYQRWAADYGKPYPHPDAASGDGLGNGGETGVDNVVTSTDTGYIPYMLEYYAGPAIEAVNEINAALPADQKIVLMGGSLANSRNRNNRAWMQLMTEYQFRGAYAPSLAGKYLYQVIDGITHHYLFAEYRLSSDPVNNGLNRHQVLDDMMRKFVNNGKEGNRIRYIFTTEEIGNKSSQSGRAAYQSAIICFSYLDYCLERGFPAEKFRFAFYGPEATTKGSNRNFVSAAYSMDRLAELIPNRVLSRLPDAFVDGNNPSLEKYAFTTDRGEILLAIHTPNPANVPAPAPQSFASVRINIPAGASYVFEPKNCHLFTIDEYLTPNVTIIPQGDNILELTVGDSYNHTNNSLAVENGRLTKFNGTLVILLKKN